MARILIGWEFGANRGHAVRMSRLGEVLCEAGHEPVFAVQRVDALSPEEAGGAEIWQAPLTPRLLVNSAKVAPGVPVSLGDIVARLGMDDAGLVAAMIGAWRRLLSAIRPDLVVSEYAPFMLLAARMRVASLAIGTGFQTPPPEMESFPALLDRKPLFDEATVLASVNAALATVGDAPVAALPEIFTADRVVTDTITELDPYAGRRNHALASPVPVPFEVEAGEGDEIFVYAPETMSADAPLWRGLAEAGLPTRVHVNRAAPGLAEAVTALGMTFEPRPLPIATIAERSRLLVSHGGHDFVCAGLAAGLPHVVCYVDVEKHFHGRALARHGLGGHVAMRAIEPGPFAESLKSVHADEALNRRARAAAKALRARNQPASESSWMEAVSALV